MSNKILVAYASRAGSTAGVAEAIGATLAESGAQVEVRLMNDVKDLAPYRAVVAGSAIHGGKWLPEAMQFMRTHRAAFAQKPFAAFLVCMTLAMSNDKYREHVAGFLQPVRTLVRPERGPLCRGAGHQQSAVVSRQADVSLECRLRRLVGGRSPGLERHSRLGRKHPSAAAPVDLTGRQTISARYDGAQV